MPKEYDEDIWIIFNEEPLGPFRIINITSNGWMNIEPSDLISDRIRQKIKEKHIDRVRMGDYFTSRQKAIRRIIYHIEMQAKILRARKNRFKKELFKDNT